MGQTYIFYFELIILGVVVFSGIKISLFLKKKGVKRSLLYIANPLMYKEYCKITKEETGKCGIWFKICVAALLAIIIILFWEEIVIC